jgi:hypothetical protein
VGYAMTMQLGADGEATNRDVQSGQQPATDEATTRLGARYTVQEAAEILGASVDAVRGRIRRGTLNSMKVDGIVYVLLDETSRDRHSEKTTSRLNETDGDQAANPDQSELVGELRDQIDWLRREVERKDTIIMSMAQRIPELEAPPAEPRDGPETASAEGEGVEVPLAEKKHSSWWRWFFGA